MKEVSFFFEFVHITRITREAISSGDMMIENDDLRGDIRELSQFISPGGDVDEGHKGILAVAHANAVFMTPCDVPSVLAPGLSN